MNYTANLQITFGIVEERAIFFQMISQKNEDAMRKKTAVACLCLWKLVILHRKASNTALFLSFFQIYLL